MATAKQLRALFKSYGDRDDEHFYAVAMQLAAHEARLGHGKLARELRTLIDDAREKRPAAKRPPRPVPLALPRGELAGLLSASYPDARLPDMILPKDDIVSSIRSLTSRSPSYQRALDHSHFVGATTKPLR